jgi:hypothetical protein
MSNFMLSYETSVDGINRAFFSTYQDAKEAGDQLNTYYIVPNVELSRLVPAGRDYERGIFDEHGNRFAAISTPVVKKEWED